MNRSEGVKQAIIALTSGQGENAVHLKLKDSGFANAEAESILQDALKVVQGAKDKARKKVKMVHRIAGLSLIVIGIGMATYTFLGNKPGGVVIIPLGLIGFGVYMLMTGDNQPNAN